MTRLATCQLRIILIVSALALFPGRVNPQTQRIEAQGDSYKVMVLSVVRMHDSEGRTLYNVNYVYKFSTRDSVYVDGVGTLPAGGAFKYLTAVPRLTFRETASGTVLVTVPLRETMKSMGGGDVEFPPVSSFTASPSRYGEWSSGVSFPRHAMRVLDKYFVSGYEAFACEDRQCYRTTFRVMPLPRNRKVKVAVVISRPSPESGVPDSFRLQYKAYQKTGSGLWEAELEQAPREAVDGFINELLRALKEKEG